MCVSTYPPLCESSVLSPDRPELMDNSVGDCLSAMLQEDMLMGRDRPYGSRLNAEADNSVRTNQNKAVYKCCQICHNLSLNRLPFA